MPLTLRQRNRLATLDRITEVALALFDERGYTQVTIEEIAAAAGVSARTFYRYFGTKEGLFTTDTFAAVGHDVLADLIDPGDLPGTIERIVIGIATAGGENGRAPWGGMRYVIEEPAVRGAVYAALDRFSGQLAELLRSAGADATAARVTARTYCFGVYFGALEQWHLEGRPRPLVDYVRAGAASLRPDATAPSA